MEFAMIASMKFLLVLAAVFSLRAELFVSSYENSKVLRFDSTTGALIDVFIPNADGRLQLPHGLAFGRDGNLYVASAGNDSVLRYDGQTGAFIDAFVATGSGGLDYPVALIFRNQYLYVSSQLNDRVLRYNALTGAFVDVFVEASAELDGPSDMTFGEDGNLYVVGRFNSRVVRYSGSTGAFDRAFVTSNLSQPFGLRFLPFTEQPERTLLVVSGNDNTVQRFGASTGNYKNAFANGLNFPIGVEIGPDTNVYVANFGADSVVRYNGQTGALIDTFIPSGRGGLNGPNFMTFRPPPRPELSIKKTVEGVEISWPEETAGYSLFQAESPLFDNESFVIETPSAAGGKLTVETTAADSAKFYRLVKP